jgi:hypothetical protein
MRILFVRPHAASPFLRHGRAYLCAAGALHFLKLPKGMLEIVFLADTRKRAGWHRIEINPNWYEGIDGRQGCVRVMGRSIGITPSLHDFLIRRKIRWFKPTT